MPYKYFVPIFLATASLLNSAPVNNATELNNAIIAANGGGPDIEFGSSFNYSQLFQPLNADNVLNSVNNTFTIHGNGKTLRAKTGTHRGFFARTSTGTVTIKDLKIRNATAFLGGEIMEGEEEDWELGGAYF